MLFWWEPMKRQVRIQGAVEDLTSQISDNYFASRSRESQLGAWASRQSEEISERSVLEQRLHDARARFEGDVPRPKFWGGYKIVPTKIEFWQGRTSRLHDRFVYLRRAGGWSLQRLMP